MTDPKPQLNEAEQVRQDNFEAALDHGYRTLSMLLEAARETECPRLKDVEVHKLEKIAWDLDALAAAARGEIFARSNDPIDLG